MALKMLYNIDLTSIGNFGCSYVRSHFYNIEHWYYYTESQDSALFSNQTPGCTIPEKLMSEVTELLSVLIRSNKFETEFC